MNARTLIISAGAIVALAAPTVANARMLPAKQPSKHVVKKHVASQQATKRQGQSRQIYVYAPAPAAVQGEKSLKELEDDYNADLIAHGLDPIDFSGNGTTSPAPQSTPTEASSASAADPSGASLAVAAAPSTSDPVAGSTSGTWDDC